MSDELSNLMVAPTTPPYERSGSWCAVIFGAKGTGKSTTAYGINKAQYKTAIIDFDGNSLQTVRSNVSEKKQDNFKVWNVKGLMNFTELAETDLLLQSEEVIRVLEDQIYKEVAEYQPDIIVADGYQRFNWLAEMNMRSVQRKRDLKNNSDFITGAYTGVKNRSAWKERNWILDRFYEACMGIARVGFIVTVHEKAKPKERDDEELTVYEPSWAGSLKEESQIVIRQTLTEDRSQVNRWNKVESNKLTGHTIVDLDVTGTPFKVWDWVFDKEPQYLL